MGPIRIELACEHPEHEVAPRRDGKKSRNLRRGRTPRCSQGPQKKIPYYQAHRGLVCRRQAHFLRGPFTFSTFHAQQHDCRCYELK